MEMKQAGFGDVQRLRMGIAQKFRSKKTDVRLVSHQKNARRICMGFKLMQRFRRLHARLGPITWMNLEMQCLGNRLGGFHRPNSRAAKDQRGPGL